MEIKRPKSKQPIPEHAKKVFEGVIFDVYQWEQEQFDGSKATFEKLKRPDTADVIAVTEQKEVVLTKQKFPGRKEFIGLPGGRIDDNEKPIVAAKRELLEETGYVASEINLWYAYRPMEKIDWVIYIFIAKGCKRNEKPNPDPGEKIMIETVTIDEFIEMATSDNFRDVELTQKLIKMKLDHKINKFKRLLK
ncbi:NUDIX domain-containing protein [Candidatus Dojkabacteria bacterium]|nr:NUDIX domain-containing protein [Candidatus Dojkabacteria bacterium]